MKNLIYKIKLWWAKRQAKKAVREKLKKLQKKDPFIYK